MMASEQIVECSHQSVSGTVTDDGLPGGHGLLIGWSQASGGGTATFATPGEDKTDVTFSAPGDYVLALAASDGQYTTSASLTVHVEVVNFPPVVTMGQSQTLQFNGGPVTTAVSATATDDGLPLNPETQAPGMLTYQWTALSTGAAATFASPTSLTTNVTFAAPGTYALQFAASDGQFTSTGTLSVVVLSPNANAALNIAPVLRLGASATVAAGSPVTLTPTALSDDGLPPWPGGATNVALAWEGIAAGPSRDAEIDADNGALSATFDIPGVYTVGKAVTDGQLLSYTEQAVYVSTGAGNGNTAPAVSLGPGQVVAVGTPLVVNPTVSDDGLPYGTLTYQWTPVSGPAAPSFANTAVAATTVTFGTAGEYVLQLSVSDGQLTSWTTLLVEATSPTFAGPPSIEVALNHAPLLTLGVDASEATPDPTNEILVPTLLSDDGCCSSGAVYLKVAVVSGPTTDARADLTPAGALGDTFGLVIQQPGLFVVGATATDGHSSRTRRPWSRWECRPMEIRGRRSSFRRASTSSRAAAR